MRFAIYIYGNFVGHADLEAHDCVFFDPESAKPLENMKLVLECARVIRRAAAANWTHCSFGGAGEIRRV